MRALILPLLAVVLTACQTTSAPVPSLVRKAPSTHELALGMSAVKSQLKDPSSAQLLSHAAYGQGTDYTELCLGVNARNGFGGYVGERTAHIVIVAGTVRSVVINRPGHDNSAVERCVALEQNRSA